MDVPPLRDRTRAVRPPMPLPSAHVCGHNDKAGPMTDTELIALRAKGVECE